MIAYTVPNWLVSAAIGALVGATVTLAYVTLKMLHDRNHDA